MDDVALRLGVMCTIGPGRLIPFLQAFRDRHPRVQLMIEGRNAQALQDRLARGDHDVAIYGLPEGIDERFHARKLYEERFVIGVQPGHPFERQNAVRMAELDKEPYVGRTQCEFNEYIGNLLCARGVKVMTVFRSDRDDWVQSMALAGLGFTDIPEYSVTLSGLCPLIEPNVVRAVQIVTVRGRPPSALSSTRRCVSPGPAAGTCRRAQSEDQAASVTSCRTTPSSGLNSPCHGVCWIARWAAI